MNKAITDYGIVSVALILSMCFCIERCAERKHQIELLRTQKTLEKMAADDAHIREMTEERTRRLYTLDFGKCLP